jgi:hypothetical protein
MVLKKGRGSMKVRKSMVATWLETKKSAMVSTLGAVVQFLSSRGLDNAELLNTPVKFEVAHGQRFPLHVLVCGQHRILEHTYVRGERQELEQPCWLQHGSKEDYRDMLGQRMVL